MKLPKSFEHGVAMVAMLATQKQNIPVSSLALHREVKGSLAYTKKILRKLVVGGIVSSVPGIKGGYLLASPPKDITLDQIVYALEGRSFSTFPNTGVFKRLFPSTSSKKVEKAERAIHDVFHAADNAWLHVLEQVTVEDLVHQATGNAPFRVIDWNMMNKDKKGE